MNNDRRLSDKIIAAHKLACKENNKGISTLLLEALEIDMSKVGDDLADHRKRVEYYDAAFMLHERTFGSLRIDPL